MKLYEPLYAFLQVSRDVAVREVLDDVSTKLKGITSFHRYPGVKCHEASRKLSLQWIHFITDHVRSTRGGKVIFSVVPVLLFTVESDG